MLDEILERGNLYRAFERVRENFGCRGADGMTVGQFAADLEREIDRLQDRLLRRRYRPYPLLQISVPKRSGGVRLLRVPTVRDRVVQTAVDLVVRPVFEAEFEINLYTACLLERRALRNLTLCLPLPGGEGGRIRAGLPFDFQGVGKNAPQASSLSRWG